MKTEARLTIFDSGDISPNVYTHIVKKFPQYVRNSTFKMKLPFEHGDLQNVIRILDQSGATPLDTLYPRHGDKYKLYIDRTYDDLDLTKSEYLTPRHIDDIDVEKDIHGNLVIIPNSAYLSNFNKDYLGASIIQILVSDLVADNIRELRMRGVDLRSVPIKGGAPQGAKNYWHLVSNVVMPPLSPTMVMVDENGTPHTGDSTVECYLRASRLLPDSLISDAEFHYRKQDLEGMDFDLAYTAEKIFSMNVPYPVVSQKFYQMAKSLNLPIAWKPVRLDE